VKDGRRIPALAQVGKTGYMYILDRVTGKPVFGIDERPVAKGNVPTEWYSPTQPIPVKPPAIARVSMQKEDLVSAEDTTLEHAQACRELWDKHNFYNAGPYTPLNYRTPDSVPPPSLVFPGLGGGPSWGGAAADPKLGYIFVASKDAPITGWIQKNPKSTPENLVTEFPYVRVGGPGINAPIKDATGRTANLPCFKPPWQSLIAVNANTGDIAWRVPLGINETLPEAKRNVGSPGAGGPIVTAGGLVFIGATADGRFRAFDSKTGKELWTAKLDYSVTAVPITYQGKNGKQYVAVVAAARAGGATNSEALVVFALP
jgi:quinoprotein glucose dehydrogenase